MPLGTEAGLDPDNIVLDWDPAAPPRRKEAQQLPILGPHLLWPNGWMDQVRMPLGTEAGLGPGDCVRQGASSPTERGTGHSSYCGQTAGWIRIPLGTEVSLGPGDIVLDAD